MATEVDVAALLDDLRNRREFRWNVPDWIDLDGLIAALERAERVEAAARDFLQAWIGPAPEPWRSQDDPMGALAARLQDALEGSDG